MADYVLEGPRWGTVAAGTSGGTVTWTYNSTVSALLLPEIVAAFADLSAHAGISFQELSPGASANITFGESSIDGRDNVVGQTNYSYSGSSFRSASIVFDSDENWRSAGSQVLSQDQANFFVVALHEIGHAVGLDHYNAAPAVMNATLSPTVTDLTTSDIDGLQALYGASQVQTASPVNSGAAQTGSTTVLLQSGDAVAAWQISGGMVQSSATIGNANGYAVTGTGDFNGDGAADVLFSGPGGTIADWTLQNGAFQSGAVLGNSNGYTVAGTGDFNGDGTLDVLFNNASGYVAEWLVSDNAVQSGAVIGTANGYGVIGTGDFNGDGTSDVLLENGYGSVIDWMMQGGAYQSYNMVGNASGYGVVGKGDFDGDGNTDILLENASGNVIDWLMQNGQYAGWNEVGNAAGYGIVATGDYNGDGTTDVLLENASRNVIDWTLQNGTYAGYTSVGNAGSYVVKGS